MQASPLDILRANVGFDYVDTLLRRYNQAKTKRIRYEARWHEIQDLIYPEGVSFAAHQPTIKDTPLGANIHSSEVVAKVNRMITLLCSSIIKRGMKFFDLTFENIYIRNLLENSVSAHKWLDACVDVNLTMMNSPDSNFDSGLKFIIGDWFRLGIAYGSPTFHQQGYFNLDCADVTTCAITVNGFNKVSEVYRELILNANQAFDLYGSNISTELQAEARRYDDGRHTFIECNVANPIMQVLKEAKYPVYPYSSIVVDMGSRQIVDFRLSSKLPYVVPRFNLGTSELYGHSYVWNSIYTIKMINKLHKAGMAAMDFKAMPMTFIKPDLAKFLNRIAPGAWLPWDDSSGQPPAIPFPHGEEPKILLDYINYLSSLLDETLGCRDLFADDVPNKTAYEVQQKTRQIIACLSPIITRFESECLSPLVDLCLSFLIERNMLPQFPYKEVAYEIKMDIEQLLQILPVPYLMLSVSFSGQLAKLQKEEETFSYERALQFASQIIGLYPSSLNRINLAEIVKKGMLNILNDDTIINSDEIVDQLNEAMNNQINLNDEKLKAEIEHLNAQSEKLRAEAAKLMSGLK